MEPFNHGKELAPMELEHETGHSTQTRVLLTGGTGYVGGLLLDQLLAQGIPVRCMARDPQKLADKKGLTNDSSHVELVTGDVTQAETLAKAFEGIQTAYYLIHGMGVGADFVETDRKAARNFLKAAQAAGVKRIIYLGGLGRDDDPHLSDHLKSRHEVGEILRSSAIPTIEFRASVIIGDGSLSFDTLRALTDRLPVMLCPKWLSTPTQPIAVDDVLDYLLAAREIPLEESLIVEIGNPQVLTYGDLIRAYADLRGLKRFLITIPLLTPYLSSLWLGLVTPATADVGRHLIEGLKNPTIVTHPQAQQKFQITPMSVQEAIRRAISSRATKKAGRR